MTNVTVFKEIKKKLKKNNFWLKYLFNIHFVEENI